MNQEPEIEISIDITDFLFEYSAVIESLQRGENINPELLNRALSQLSQLSGINIRSIEAINFETPTILDVTSIVHNEDLYEDRELKLKLTLSKQGLELAEVTESTFKDIEPLRTLNKFLRDQKLEKKSFKELSEALGSCTIYQPKNPEDQIIVVSTWPEYTVISYEDETNETFLNNDPLLAEKLAKIIGKTGQIIQTTVVEEERNLSQVREETRDILSRHQPPEIASSPQDFLARHQDSLLVWGDADQVDNATVATVKAELTDVLGFEVLAIATNHKESISALSSSRLGGIKYDPQNPEHQVYGPTISARGEIEIHGETYDFRVRTPFEDDAIQINLTIIAIAESYDFYTAYRASGMQGHPTSIGKFDICIDEDGQQVFIISDVTTTEQQPKDKPLCMIEIPGFPVQVYKRRTPERGGITNYYRQHKVEDDDLRLKPRFNRFKGGLTIENKSKEIIYPPTGYEVKFTKIKT